MNNTSITLQDSHAPRELAPLAPDLGREACDLSVTGALL
jgi:hypothetical protein